MSKNRCLPSVLAIACFALSLPAHADDVPEPGRAAVQVDEATLLIDGEFDHGILHQTTELESSIVCHCDNVAEPDCDNVAEPDIDIEFEFQATATFTVSNAYTGRIFRSIDSAALVTKCVGPQCPDGDTGSYGLLFEDPLELLFLNVVLLDYAANLVAPGVTYQCDDNVDRVIVVDTPNTFDMGDELSGFGW